MEKNAFEAPRIASLLNYFAVIKDFRDGWRVAHRERRCCSSSCAALPRR